eukprot:5435166-Amphidinium_carterae.1
MTPFNLGVVLRLFESCDILLRTKGREPKGFHLCTNILARMKILLWRCMVSLVPPRKAVHHSLPQQLPLTWVVLCVSLGCIGDCYVRCQ